MGEVSCRLGPVGVSFLSRAVEVSQQSFLASLGLDAASQSYIILLKKKKQKRWNSSSVSVSLSPGKVGEPVYSPGHSGSQATSPISLPPLRNNNHNPLTVRTQAFLHMAPLPSGYCIAHCRRGTGMFLQMQNETSAHGVEHEKKPGTECIEQFSLFG